MIRSTKLSWKSKHDDYTEISRWIEQTQKNRHHDPHHQDDARYEDPVPPDGHTCWISPAEYGARKKPALLCFCWCLTSNFASDFAPQQILLLSEW
eukprot:760105-Hanusia_phi.AAC.1